MKQEEEMIQEQVVYLDLPVIPESFPGTLYQSDLMLSEFFSDFKRKFLKVDTF